MAKIIACDHGNLGRQCEICERDEEIADLRCRIEQDRAELSQLRSEIKEWLCEQCNTVFPGPPAQGFTCVICPLCGGSTAPRHTIERKRDRATLAACREVLDKAKHHIIAHRFSEPNDSSRIESERQLWLAVTAVLGRLEK